MRWLYKLLHFLFLGRAIGRGPSYLARYEVRRRGRKLLYKATRAPRKRR